MEIFSDSMECIIVHLLIKRHDIVVTCGSLLLSVEQTSLVSRVQAIDGIGFLKIPRRVWNSDLLF